MSSSELKEKCSIGVYNDDLCHKSDYTRRQELIYVEDLNENDLKLIKLRSGIKEIASICNHHKTVYLQRFEQNEKYCCDPFRKHAKLISSKFNLLF